MDLWREEKLPPQRKDTLEPGATTSMGTQVTLLSTLSFLFVGFFFSLFLNLCHIFHQAVNLLETEPELIFIKEEAYDEHPIGQQIGLTDNRKSTTDSIRHRDDVRFN